MIVKHNILKELYQVQIVSKQDNVTLIDFSMDMDLLRSKIKSNETDFQSSIDVLYENKEIEIFAPDNDATITITRVGIVSLGTKKYYNEHIKQSRECVLYYAKLIGIIATVLVIITAIIKLVDYFTGKPL